MTPAPPSTLRTWLAVIVVNTGVQATWMVVAIGAGIRIQMMRPGLVSHGGGGPSSIPDAIIIAALLIVLCGLIGNLAPIICRLVAGSEGFRDWVVRTPLAALGLGVVTSLVAWAAFRSAGWSEPTLVFTVSGHAGLPVAQLTTFTVAQRLRRRRARRRAARGACGACGYPRGTSERCTECGATIQPPPPPPTRLQRVSRAVVTYATIGVLITVIIANADTRRERRERREILAQTIAVLNQRVYPNRTGVPAGRAAFDTAELEPIEIDMTTPETHGWPADAFYALPFSDKLLERGVYVFGNHVPTAVYPLGLLVNISLYGGAAWLVVAGARRWRRRAG